MALKIKKKRREIAEIPLASTSDIAFLLIVFYLAASSLIEMKGVQIPLPKPDSPPMEVLKKNIYRIEISETGSFIHDRETLEKQKLLETLIHEKGNNPEIVVVLSVSPAAPSGSVPEAIRILRDAQIEKFSMGIKK